MVAISRRRAQDYAEEFLSRPRGETPVVLRRHKSGVTLLHGQRALTKTHASVVGQAQAEFMAEALGVSPKDVNALVMGIPLGVVASGVLNRSPLVRRINFIADYVGDVSYPGIGDIVRRLASEGPTITPEGLVEGCLRLLGHYELTEENHQMLVNHARDSGVSSTDSSEFPRQVAEALQMIVATKEYLYA